MERSYLFYTDDGYTTAPNNEALDSLQILGLESCKTSDAAFSALSANNPWIAENGFDADKIQYHVVVSDVFMKSVKIVTDYLLSINGAESERLDSLKTSDDGILCQSIKLLHENVC